MHRGTITVYDREADRWTATRRGGSGDGGDREAARSFRALTGPGLILDLGCGPARLLPELGEPVLGIDASMAMLTLARGDGHGPIAAGDLEHLPVRAASAAGAFGNFSFQHLPRDGFARALAEVRRVLRPGGLLQLAVQAGDYEGDDRPGDDLPGRWFTYWQEAPLRDALVEVGFAVRDVVEADPSLRVTAEAPERPCPTDEW